MCALVFDEWVKELAALALEHVACQDIQLPTKWGGRNFKSSYLIFKVSTKRTCAMK